MLEGKPSGDRPDSGPAVCVCLNVGRNTILRAIDQGTTRFLSDLGNLLNAGSACGSCRPELNALLAQRTVKVAAE